MPAFHGGSSARLPDLPIQYADFAEWQRQWLTGDALEKQLSYWKDQLRDNGGFARAADGSASSVSTKFSRRAISHDSSEGACRIRSAY